MVARRSAANGFVGVAPDTRVVPVRVVAVQGSNPPTVDPAVAGTRHRVGDRPARGRHLRLGGVVQRRPRVAQAVRDAESAGIPVIAAVGDRGGPNDTDPTPYPAAYAGVLGVGAVDAVRRPLAELGPRRVCGRRRARRERADHLAGPGHGVGERHGRGRRLRGGHRRVGPRRWDLSPAQVRAQLRASALPPPGAPRAARPSAPGVVIPYGAVTELAAAGSPPARAVNTPGAPARPSRSGPPPGLPATTGPPLLAVAALALVLLVLVAALATPARTAPVLAPDPGRPPGRPAGAGGTTAARAAVRGQARQRSTIIGSRRASGTAGAPFWHYSFRTSRPPPGRPAAC